VSPVEKPASGKLARPVNPPGLPELRYRVGTFDGFVEEMLDRLTLGLQAPVRSEADSYVTQSDQSAPVLAPRRIRVHLEGPDHWLVALVKSWATVADVLTFYQERIVNEGYLRTARESRSIHELVQMISYHPGPGVAGSAELALTLSDIKGLPEELLLREGLVIRSIPPPGAEPQVFETVEPLFARARWNLLRPQPIPRELAPLITGSSTRLAVAGTGTGLIAGNGVLLTGLWKGTPTAFFRLLTEVRLVAGSAGATGAGATPPYTEIGWTDPLDAANPDEELTLPDLFSMRHQTGLFGHNAPRWQDLAPEVRQQVQTLEGGVLISGDGGGARSWAPMNRGLPVTVSLRCLAVDPSGDLFLGTTDGIFRSLDGGVTWKLVRRGLQQSEILTLAAGPHGSLYAGTAAGGVYRSTDRGEIWELANGSGVVSSRGLWTRPLGVQAGPLPATTVRSLVVASGNERSVLYAGTDSGVFRSGDAGRSWLPVNRGLPGTDPDSGTADLVVDSLALGAEPGLLFAGTARGVFKSTNGGRRWHSVNRGIPATDPFTTLSNTEVHSLVAYRDRRRKADHLLAGTAVGLFRSLDGGEHWHRAGLPDQAHGIPMEVLSLAVVDDPATLVTRLYAGTPQGLWSSTDHGLTWVQAALGRPARVDAIAVGPNGNPLVLATPFAGFSTDWPDYRLQGGKIDLDTVVPGVVPGSWVVLRSGDAADPAPAGIYQILRTSAVQRRDFSLAATVTRIEVVAPDARLATFDLRQTRAWVQSELLPLRPRIVKDMPKALRGLRDELLALGEPARKLIVVGRAPRSAGDPPADSLGMTVLASELAAALDRPGAIGASGTVGTSDVITLRRPVSGLDVILDSETLQVFGNVVEAMEGVTVANEMIGSGDATQANQSFTLSQPLTFRRTPLGAEAALRVEVQRQLWNQVEMLRTENGDSRSFRLRLDHEGRATVTFGDGESGARLPSGTDNVLATYRTGMSFRTVPPNGLSLLASRPLGLDTVTNPMPTVPGAPAEGPEEIRRSAPRQVRTLQRIVSLRDYDDFAQQFPGIAKAGAWNLLVAGSPAVQITVAGPGGAAVDEELAAQLREAIDASRAHPMPVYIQSYRQVPVAVTAGVQIDSRFHWEDVKKQIEALLEARFGFEESRFGGVMSAAAVVSLIQAVPAVVSVDLDAFSAPGLEAGAGVDAPLERRALPPSWSRAEGFTPAELVLLAPPVLHEIGAR
jgi:photosystem II stability/assembly factor-like uncharacterized protein